MTQSEICRESSFQELARDPSLQRALGVGTLLTGFLLVAHSCCLFLTDSHLVPLLQIYSFAG